MGGWGGGANKLLTKNPESVKSPTRAASYGSWDYAECDQFSVSILSVRYIEEKVIMKGLHHHENYPRL